MKEVVALRAWTSRRGLVSVCPVLLMLVDCCAVNTGFGGTENESDCLMDFHTDAPWTLPSVAMIVANEIVDPHKRCVTQGLLPLLDRYVCMT